VTDELPAHILDQAVNWAVKLRSGQAGARDRQACETWRKENRLHEAAWQALNAIDQEFGKIPEALGGLARKTLEGTPDELHRIKARRRVVKSLFLGTLALGLGYGLWQSPFLRPKPVLHKTYVTAIGQRRTLSLLDGSRLFLNTGSGIRVDFTREKRKISLTSGEVFVETGKDRDGAGGRRPFWVVAGEDGFEAIGTRFNVRKTDAGTQIHVARGQVNIHPGQNPMVPVRAGQTFVVSSRPGGVPTAQHDPALDPGAWVRGTLVVRKMPLFKFARELSRYHSGPIDCDPSAANLTLSGVFQLRGGEDPARILAALTQTLDVVVEKRGRTGYRIRKKKN